MHETDRQRVITLLQRLERLEAHLPAPEDAAIHAVAQRALLDEISRLIRQDQLAVYRKGNTVDVVSLA